MTDPSFISGLQQVLGGDLLSISRPAVNRWSLELDTGDSHVTSVDFLTKNHNARLITITCVDTPAHFEILHHLEAEGQVVTLRSKVWKPDDSLKSVAEVNPAAELIEHEITELFGLKFEGNPRPDNMIIPQDRKDSPLQEKPSQLDSRIDGNIATIIEHGSTTAPSKRVMKSRGQMGMPENPPLCSVSCPAKTMLRELADATGTTARHPNLRKREGDG